MSYDDITRELERRERIEAEREFEEELDHRDYIRRKERELEEVSDREQEAAGQINAFGEAA